MWGNYWFLRATSDNYGCFFPCNLVPLLSFKISLERWASPTAHDIWAAPLMRQQSKVSQKERTNVSSEDKVRGEERNGGMQEKGWPSIVFCCLCFLLINVSTTIKNSIFNTIFNTNKVLYKQYNNKMKSNCINNKSMRRSSAKDKNAPCTVYTLSLAKGKLTEIQYQIGGAYQ